MPQTLTIAEMHRIAEGGHADDCPQTPCTCPRQQAVELMVETRNAAENFAKTDRAFSCRACGARFTPAEHQWIFYDLCDGCFAEFDGQKMDARAKLMFPHSQAVAKYPARPPGTESVAEWIAWKAASKT